MSKESKERTERTKKRVRMYTVFGPNAAIIERTAARAVNKKWTVWTKDGAAVVVRPLLFFSFLHSRYSLAMTHEKLLCFHLYFSDPFSTSLLSLQFFSRWIFSPPSPVFCPCVLFFSLHHRRNGKKSLMKKISSKENKKPGELNEPTKTQPNPCDEKQNRSRCRWEYALLFRK